MTETAPQALPKTGKNALQQALPDKLALEGQHIKRIQPLDYRVRIPSFEGPLDLLLHLIRKEQLDINDIPISHICKKYLEYLNFMAELDVNVAGEFLVMASTLVVMKSQVLLPVEKEEEEEDVRIPLVAQLLELERFKKAADDLDALEWMDRDLYARPASAIQAIIPKEALNDGPIAPIDNYKLLVCFKGALDRTRKPKVAITAPQTNIKETVVSMTNALGTKEIWDFRGLVPENAELPKKRRIIMTFLAMLELARLKFISIVQLENLGPIQIKRLKPLEELDVSMLEQF